MIQDYTKLTKQELVKELERVNKKYLRLKNNVENKKKLEKKEGITEPTLNILDSTPFAYLKISSDGKTEYICSKLTNLIGYTIEDVPDVQSWFLKGFKKEDYRAYVQEIWNYALSNNSNNENWSFEFDCKSGKKKIIRFFGTELPNGSYLIFFEDVSDLHKSRAAIEKSEKKYKDLFTNGSDAIYLWKIIDGNTPGKFVDVNNAAKEMLGYTKSEFCKMTPIDIADDQCKQKNKEYFTKLFGNGSVRFRSKQKRGDGTSVDVEIFSRIIERENKKYGLSYTRDISEWIRSQELLNKYFDYTLVSSIIINVEKWNFEKVNNEFARILNLSTNEVLNVPVLDFVHPDDKESTLKNLYALAKGKKVAGFTNRLSSNKKNYRIIEWNAICDSDRKFIYALGSDVTEKVKAQSELKKSEIKFRTMIENSHDGIAIINNNFVAEYVNNRMCEIIKLQREDLLGIDIRKVINDKAIVKLLDLCSKGGKSELFEYTKNTGITTKDGVKKFINVSTTTLRESSSGKSIMLQVKDITEQKKSEKLHSVLLRISQAVNYSKDLREFLIVVQKELAKIIDTSNFYIALYEESTNSYSFPYLDDKYDDIGSIEILDLSGSLTDYVRRSVKPLLARKKDQKKLEEQKIIEGVVGSNSEVWIGAPLIVDDNSIGVIAVQNYERDDAFDDNDLELLQIISENVSSAIWRKKISDKLSASERRYKDFISRSSEGIYRVEFTDPVDSNLPVKTQIEQIIKNSRIAECNESMARMYGYSSAEELLGKSLFDLYGSEINQENYLANEYFINSNYSIVDTETAEIDKDGQRIYFQNNSIGIISGEKLVNIWGIQNNITTRKSAELALRESEEKFSKAFNSTPDTILITNLTDGKIIDVNDSFTRSTGYSKEEALNKTVIDLNLWKYPEQRKIYVKKFLKEKKIVNYEIEFRMKNGSSKIGLISAEYIYLSGQLVTLGVIRDITDRKIFENALRKSEELNRNLLEASPVGILYLDSIDKISYENNALRKFRSTKSIKTPEILGRDVVELMAAKNPEITKLLKILRSGNSFTDYDLDFITMNGKSFQMEVSGAPLLDDKGLYQGGIVMVQDVSERKKTEEILRAIAESVSTDTGESFFRLLVEYINTTLNMDYVYVATYDSKTNTAKTLAYWKEYEIGENFEYNLAGTPCENVLQHCSAIYPNKVMDLFPEDKFLAINNINCYMGRTLFDGDGNPVGIIVIMNKAEIKNYKFYETVLKIFAVRSSSELERLNYVNKLVKAKNDAEKANVLKSEFLAQMSHEIRTPINTILSFSSLVQEELYEQIDDELKSSFFSINNAGKRIIRTIDLILNMSEIQAGTYNPKYNHLRLKEEILDDIYAEFYFHCKAKDLKIKLTSEIVDTTIFADSYTVGQIFNNLVDNAVKYTREGNIEIKIQKDDKENVVVNISDTGIGISENYVPYLFSPFTQEDTGYTRKYEGNGLGLALVKKYCEVNNAEISVMSEKGIGTNFTVTFKKDSENKLA